MPTNPPKFNRDDVDVISRETVFDGFFKMERITLRHRLFEGGWSKTIQREMFRRGDAAAAILYDPVTDSIGLIEQFRVGALAMSSPWCLEVVAGMTEEGESPDELILREIAEEANIRPLKLEFISRYLSSPGGMDELIHVYCAICDLSQAGGVHGLDDESEDIKLHVFAADSVFDVMLKGRTNNAATIIGLQWLQLNRQRLRDEA